MYRFHFVVLQRKGNLRNEQESVSPVQRDYFHSTNRIVDLRHFSCRSKSYINQNSKLVIGK